MASFKLFLIGSNEPLVADLSAASVAELHHVLSTARFVEGPLSIPDDYGVCSGVLIPTSRIQLIVEQV
ncbi:hypothetical protein CA223_07630 [Sphingomonas koreensis]|jgi:hypothetical protein|uniref:Uncharacterized protein n=1 Tax=Sphingomonas koreensis TaxID=93064 RepID=A0A1L6J8G3_9SPHN|nr:hypothetical protein [Sphingomonas koreensis]APR51850.1 hypothetical protein BRX40_04850 [Sphingomonas koreensis]MDC7812064.1 hypothetical protein [Sphingomonas koreensis]RSU21468.1 hypothetical protein CA224_08330 [Sphingomonas koreensis]RSU30872.1 hypothetical protein CA222_02075 [Sphingomonas koreensis]RSU31967.1 hypothetical protein CA225_01155 [Sphingomonas koreensis]